MLNLFIVHFHVRFLAMPKLMQAWFWSFGLTKTFTVQYGADGVDGLYGLGNEIHAHASIALLFWR
jgi:hypothetical protein